MNEFYKYIYEHYYRIFCEFFIQEFDSPEEILTTGKIMCRALESAMYRISAFGKEGE